MRIFFLVLIFITTIFTQFKSDRQNKIESSILAPCCYGGIVADHNSMLAKLISNIINSLIDDNKDKDVIPDMLLKFPERNYIVDAKVSLTHWTKYINEKDEKQKKQYLKDHLASVRNHLFGPKGLVKKNYNKLYGIKSLQSIIVFFPASNLYSITLDADKTLQTEALKANFILSSPTDLLNMIKIFEQIKSEKKQIENISKIITSASKIFDKYSDVKTAIKGALQSYKTHANQLQSLVTKSWGSQGLEKQIKKLEDEHGVIPGKQIPEILSEQASISDVTDPEEDKDKLN